VGWKAGQNHLLFSVEHGILNIFLGGDTEMEVSEEEAKALGASMSMVGDKRRQYGGIYGTN
jgi:hypothetical protein